MLVSQRLLDVTGVNASVLRLLLRLGSSDMLDSIACDTGDARHGVQLLEAGALRAFADAMNGKLRFLGVYLVGVGGGDDERQPEVLIAGIATAIVGTHIRKGFAPRSETIEQAGTQSN